MTHDILAPPSPAAPQPQATPSALAFVRDGESAETLRHGFADLGIVDAKVETGDIENAISELSHRASPRLLVVDVTGLPEPLKKIDDLAQICDPNTEVVVVGDRNDVVLYRDMKEAGVAEYFFKPLVRLVVNRALGGLIGASAGAKPLHTGKLIIVLGVRGGTGCTTIAVNLAWYIAEVLQRRTLLVDLDMQRGDAALQLDVQPSHALQEALEKPDRIDDLFLERGISRVTERLGLLASLEPLSDQVRLNEAAAARLLDSVLARYRYVILDAPAEIALAVPSVIKMPGTILLVSDGTLASARDVARWREKVGPSTPGNVRMHILNKRGAEGSVPDRDLPRVLGQPEDLAIPFDTQLATASVLGIKAMQKCATVRRSMAKISQSMTGSTAEPASRPIWKRIFG
jgi:pilus assembly protein CpaE